MKAYEIIENWTSNKQWPILFVWDRKILNHKCKVQTSYLWFEQVFVLRLVNKTFAENSDSTNYSKSY